VSKRDETLQLALKVIDGFAFCFRFCDLPCELCVKTVQTTFPSVASANDGRVDKKFLPLIGRLKRSVDNGRSGVMGFVEFWFGRLRHLRWKQLSLNGSPLRNVRSRLSGIVDSGDLSEREILAEP
jgi:hypothetical protein